MPSLSTPTMMLGNTVADKRSVTVSGSMTFDAGDVGKTYRLEIKLYGEDLSGDNLPSGDAVGNDMIYTYLWNTPFLPASYKNVTVAAAGNVNFSETRNVAVDTLDEDPGKVIIGWADPNTPIYSIRKDELYARVTLSGAPVTARSATTVVGVGV
jgi:hypothetical protein